MLGVELTTASYVYFWLHKKVSFHWLIKIEYQIIYNADNIDIWRVIEYGRYKSIKNVSGTCYQTIVIPFFCYSIIGGSFFFIYGHNMIPLNFRISG